MRKPLYILLLTLTACTGAASLDIPLELLSGRQQDRMNSIGTRFMDQVDKSYWKEEAVLLDAAVAAKDLPWQSGEPIQVEANGIKGTVLLENGDDGTTLTLEARGTTLASFKASSDGSAVMQLQHYLLTTEGFADGTLDGSARFWKDGRLLASLDARKEGEINYLEADLMGELQIKGTVQQARLKDIFTQFSVATTQDEALPLVEKADACVRLGIHFDGAAEPSSALILTPYHRNNRYDDYWTWRWTVSFPDGVNIPADKLVERHHFSDFIDRLMALRYAFWRLMPATSEYTDL